MNSVGASREQPRAELALMLGESVSRFETLSEQAQLRLYALYDHHSKPLPLVEVFPLSGLRGAGSAKTDHAWPRRFDRSICRVWSGAQSATASA